MISLLLALDPVGTFVFALAGATAGARRQLDILGIARDVLLARVPMVLRSDLYAVAALAGASVVAIGSLFALEPP